MDTFNPSRAPRTASAQSPLTKRQATSILTRTRRVCMQMVLVLAGFLASLSLAPSDASAQDTAEAEMQTIAEILAEGNATPVGEGVAQIYEAPGQTLMVIKPEVFGRLFHWYVEAVVQPAQLVSADGNAVGETVMRLERRGDKVFVRDLIGTIGKRAVVDHGPLSPHGDGEGVKLNPINQSVADSGLGAIVMALDIIAEDADGSVLVDLTPTFSTDLGGDLSVNGYLARAGLGLVGVDPARSYVQSARSNGSSVNIRSHLTFAGPNGESLSIVVGHSLTALPEDQMTPRMRDDRVGYFETSFTEFGGPDVVGDRTMIVRHRLERPEGAPDGMTDPKEPILYYVGRGVPDRWRPYVKSGIERWQTAFEEAGFSNAIIARDAPTAAEDPFWSAEDTSNNVVRWIAQPIENAMGPFTMDSRTGEILGAHILFWPQVIDLFSAYYFALHSSVDPEAASYPLSDQKKGELLSYVVTHEVGHTLGLRHNQLASTAYMVAEQRDPAFANVFGGSSSIMAYGRFNQSAQPGDGVTQFIPVIGPYDKFAIKWGYSTFPGKSQAEIEQTLDEWASEAELDRTRRWAAGEAPDEFRSTFDPRVQSENSGTERIEATRLGIARLSATMASLPGATGNDIKYTRRVYVQSMSTHTTFLRSVVKLIGGITNEPGADVRYQFVPKAKQQEAVRYLLGEGSQSLEIYARDALLRNLEPVGALRQIDANRDMLMLDLVSGSKMALLEMQARIEPDAYSVSAYGDDIVQALFGELAAPSRGMQVLQVAFLDRSQDILTSPPTRNQLLASFAHQLGLGDPNAAQITLATGGGTVFPAWARQAFPPLAQRLDTAAASAASQNLALHYQALAARMRELAKLPVLQTAESAAAAE